MTSTLKRFYFVIEVTSVIIENVSVVKVCVCVLVFLVTGTSGIIGD